MLALHVLASGSKGNAAVVEDLATGRGVLVDAGICKRDLLARCREAGFDPRCIDAVLVTHDHSDHTKGLGVALRGLASLDAHPAVYALSEVRAASGEIRKIEEAADVYAMRLDDELSFGGITALPFATSHDAASSCGFRFEDAGGDAIGFMTDTGVVTGAAHEALQGVRVLALESNHDERMLREGPYPYVLKQRVASDRGHLSNDQAAAELAALLSDRLEQVVAMHLSEHNNLPLLAEKALGSVLEREGHPAVLVCASQRMLVEAR